MKDLTDSLSKLVDKIRGASHIDEETLKEVLKDLQRALLKADVDVKLVYELTKSIEEEYRKEEPPSGISSKDYLLYLIYNKLISIMGGETEAKVELTKRPYVILLVGTEGSGKTTSAGKMAYWFSRKGYRVGLIETDTVRPGAHDQLRQLAEKLNIPFHVDPNSKDAVDIALKGLEKMRKEKVDLIIIDTAGRHRNEEELMKEIKEIYNAVTPDEVVLVIDSTMGKQAAAQAEAFNRNVPINSIFLTKMDSTSRGGGALASVVRTGAKIKFVGSGEYLEDVELFNAKKFVQRLLGMGNLEELMERMKSIEEEDQVLMELSEGKFNMLTFMKQLESMTKLGPLSKLLQMLPMTMLPAPMRSLNDDQLEDAQIRMRRWLAVMRSMTREELMDPSVLDASRIKRIALGSGTTPKDVRELIRQYELMKKMVGELKRSQRRLGRFIKQ
ncbi:signal recognition particle protein [Thermocladium modestius]|uniref:Signal recognition particle 54 kDa protein n=1 Tax=Thermocladium modestius TaxID=62609 RepID=A0A830GVG6_9CREN|nr:signal recognition particle protein Srp54 [Thermocladium modestius]GGP20374.1 signal recognition particle protein [Thermocladium modestius]